MIGGFVLPFTEEVAEMLSELSEQVLDYSDMAGEIHRMCSGWHRKGDTAWKLLVAKDKRTWIRFMIALDPTSSRLWVEGGTADYDIDTDGVDLMSYPKVGITPKEKEV